ncbi:MAG: hypothetical protein WDO56_28560 [Gammaproteobacteria bacterium]
MHWSEARDGWDPEQTTVWLSSALDGSGCGAMERYLHSIEQKLDRDNIREALAMSAALPEICSMLEHPQLRTSPAHCVCWCDAWVAMDGDSQNVFPLTRVYLRDEEEDATQWIAADERFARSVSKSLLGAARTWYSTRGAYDLTVQYNLGKISGH